VFWPSRPLSGGEPRILGAVGVSVQKEVLTAVLGCKNIVEWPNPRA